MSAQGLQNLPLPELGCWPKQSGPGVLALPTRLALLLRTNQEKTWGSCAPLLPPVSLFGSIYQGWGGQSICPIPVGIHNITSLQKLPLLEPR